MPIDTPLPAAFEAEMLPLLGEADTKALLHALNHTEPATSVRLNLHKMPPHLPAATDGSVPWCETGRYLAERPHFTHDPLLHAGCYYVQEAASMCVEQAWRTLAAEGAPQHVLDLCAAPGGKSTLWRSLMPEGTLLVANEPVRQRAQILAENLTKWGHPDVVCTCDYADAFAQLGPFFDVIAADVPCSGEGMFRKEAVARQEWSPQAVDACVARQWQIVSQVWPALKPGGYLVYSTCTFNRSEDEDMVWRICHELGADCVPLPTVPEAWGVRGDVTGRSLPVMRFFPHSTRGEGLFMALLRKHGDDAPLRSRKGKRRPAARHMAAKGAAQVAGWLEKADDFKIIRPNDTHLVAVRESLAEAVQQVCLAAHALTAGVLLAEEKGRKLIPQHALALSTARSRTAFPTAELNLEQALSYLRREGLTLPPDVPRGYVLASFEGHALGWLNNLGARANNLYPAEWRIRF